MELRKNLTRLLLIASGIVYILAIIAVGNISLASPNLTKQVDESGEYVLNSDGEHIMVDAKPPEIDDFYLTIISLIGTALAIHTGKLLGIELEEDRKKPGEQEPEARKPFFQQIWDHWLVVWIRKIIKSILTFDLKLVPEVATVLYLAGLVIATVYYLIEGHSPASAEVLKTSWSSLLGIFASIWSSDVSER